MFASLTDAWRFAGLTELPDGAVYTKPPNKLNEVSKKCRLCLHFFTCIDVS